MEIKTGFADINGAQLYYEIAGNGTPLIMIHAGIADSRMWDNEFAHFANKYQVIRFDMRGYGKSLPANGQFNVQDDLEALLNTLSIKEPLILMGCSIGAGLAMEFALTYHEKVQALILVGGTPRGLELDSNDPDHLFEEGEKAFKDKKIDLVAEIDMQIWFDGVERDPKSVDKVVRQKAYDMARLVAEHEVKEIGEHIRKQFDKPAGERLDELTMPTLVVVGENDLEYIRVHADYMESHIPNATKIIIPNAAHLPNMEHPQHFHPVIDKFLT